MKRQSSSIPVVLLGVILLVAFTASKVTAEEYEIEARIFKSRTGATMPYRILKPDNYNPKEQYPLVLCLHGAGGRGNDNRSRGTEAFKVLSSPDVQKEHPSFVVPPQCQEGVHWGNSPDGSDVRYIDLVLEVLEWKLVW